MNLGDCSGCEPHRAISFGGQMYPGDLPGTLKVKREYLRAILRTTSDLPSKQRVAGSSPAAPTIIFNHLAYPQLRFSRFLAERYQRRHYKRGHSPVYTGFSARTKGMLFGPCPFPCPNLSNAGKLAHLPSAPPRNLISSTFVKC